MKRFFKLFISLNPTSITTILTILTMTLFLIGVPILDLVELKTFDLRFLSRGIEKPSHDVVMAVIDEKSLDTEGRWPWSRSKIADLITHLSMDGAKVVGFDIGFLEPDENTNLQFINQFDQKIETLQIENNNLNKFIEESRLTADNDLILARAIKESTAKVILGYFFHMSQSGLDYQIDQKEIDEQMARISNSRYPLIQYEQQDMAVDPFFKAYAPEGNLEILSEAADSSGFFNMFTEADGVVRWMPLIIKSGEEIFTPLSVQSIRQYLDRPQLMVKVASYGVEGIQMGKTFIPTNESGQILINYLGPAKTFPHYSISDILHDKLPKGTFKDKIVLVGATAIGIYDLRNTPFSPIFPGLEIHATVIDNIINRAFLNKPTWTKIYDVPAILVLGLITGTMIHRLSALKGLLFASALFMLHIFTCRWLFINSGLWFNIVYPLLALALVYVALTIYRYLVEEKNKRFLYATFSSYLSPDLIEEMVRSETMPELGARQE